MGGSLSVLSPSFGNDLSYGRLIYLPTIIYFIELYFYFRVEEVVKGFMLLLEVDDNNGAVMTVTKKHGVQYRHGKPLSHKL